MPAHRKYASEEEREAARREQQRQANARYRASVGGKAKRNDQSKRHHARTVATETPAQKHERRARANDWLAAYRQTPGGRQKKREKDARRRGRKRSERPPRTPRPRRPLTANEAAELAGAGTHAEDAARRYMAARASYLRIEHDASVTPARKRAIAAGVHEAYQEALQARARAIATRKRLERRRSR